jgi:hypothetical protein
MPKTAAPKPNISENQQVREGYVDPNYAGGYNLGHAHDHMDPGPYTEMTTNQVLYDARIEAEGCR